MDTFVELRGSRAMDLQSAADFERSWQELERLVAPGDIIMVRNTRNVMSWLISRIDRGPWSHSAIYIGNGLICEAIVSGVVKRPLAVYKSQRFHVGLYRLGDDADVRRRAAAAQFVQMQIGKPYAFREADFAGLRRLLRIQPRKVRSTPNVLAARDGVRLLIAIR